MRTPEPQDDIRSEFAAAISKMYRAEVPAYGTLIELVEDINAEVLARDETLEQQLSVNGGLERVNDERHGAIRLGSFAELKTMARFFRVLGMHPVGYYDLGPAGIPVQSTSFRPITSDALAASPFRMFTSVLNLAAIEDPELRETARELIDNRNIFSRNALRMLDLAETGEGLSKSETSEFISAFMETFRWHSDASIGLQLYERLLDSHRLVADIVSFQGPHINHLTPRTLDIDVAHATMSKRGITPKETIEGPPKRKCPILLRQTSFMALSESVNFPSPGGELRPGSHTARFGEIEQRGIALTPEGRQLYDLALKKSQGLLAEGGNAHAALSMAFASFPDSYDELRRRGLGYFEFRAIQPLPAGATPQDLDELVGEGFVRADPIIYEDFLPVSAASIFQSNLSPDASPTHSVGSEPEFTKGLGVSLIDPFTLYQNQSDESLKALFG